MLRSVLHHTFAFVKQRTPHLLVFLKLVTSLLLSVIQHIYAGMMTVVVPFVSKEWQKYHPLVVLFCLQQQHALIKHCTLLYIVVTKLLDKWKNGNATEQVPEVTNTTTSLVEIEPSVSAESQLLPYFAHPLISNDAVVPNISVTTSVLLANRSSTAEEPTVWTTLPTNALEECAQAPVADWNDTITAFIIRVSMIVIMCILIAISQ